MKQGLITLIPKPNKNKLHDMKRSVSRWLTRDITVFGSRPLQAEDLSKLIYPRHSLHVSPQNIKKANYFSIPVEPPPPIY